LISRTDSILNSRPNLRRPIAHLRLHETPNLGVHETGSSSVHVKFQKHARVIARLSRGGRRDPAEPQIGKVQRPNERLDDMERVVVVDPIVEALGQEAELRTICLFDEANG
jgi:hypothetical protein